MLEKKIKFKKSVEENKPKSEVKELFLDYEAAYKRLRNPSNEHINGFRDMYFLYTDYMSKKMEMK